MPMIGVLIGIVIALSVGISMIPILVDTVNNLPGDMPESVTVLAHLLPIISIATIIIGAVAFIGR